MVTSGFVTLYRLVRIVRNYFIGWFVVCGKFTFVAKLKTLVFYMVFLYVIKLFHIYGAFVSIFD